MPEHLWSGVRDPIPEGVEPREPEPEPPPAEVPDFAWRMFPFEGGEGAISELAGGRARVIVCPSASYNATRDDDGIVDVLVGAKFETRFKHVTLRDALAQTERILRTRYPQYFRKAVPS